ncbi:AAA family ATPase [Aquimarina sp. MMG016]|uniref:ATP-dependent nuclease n=1 Tax=Aquimarina sp. MMG016 TaxID=2822690 RepID=UPI001B39CF9A|nr:AAA family ATPase [Aquimarina sp. MMG016]MBQ4818892.1 AAA family ATPase [Aquimarina sp. MMG016]
MYLSNIKIWNFRKIGTSDSSGEIRADNPGIDLALNPILNVLVGENNSGKTAIIDAIRFLLGTHSLEYQRIDERDFYSNQHIRCRELRVDCLFSGFTDQEAGHFLEWLHFNDKKQYQLRVWLYAYLRNNRVIYNVRAGVDQEGAFIDGGAKDLLRLTYLKPLRDAEAELSPGYRSRLAQILSSDPLFKDQFDADQKKVEHTLEKYILRANSLVKEYFSKETLDQDEEYRIEANTPGGGPIKQRVQEHLNDFFHSEDPQNPEFNISGSELNSILRKLGLELEENRSGLGALNQLFIAAELLLLQGTNHKGLRLALIEELEAHLHPQAQLRVISAIQDKQQEFNNQFILTTHSTTLASKIHLDNLILCQDGQTYSLAHGQTGLEKDDYDFLERFLDATKANLFFAKGVLLVEGDAENILIPAIAEILERPLHKYGVSVVNVGSKALLRYAKIFQRQPEGSLPIKVAVLTDLDIEQVNPSAGIVKSKKRKTTGAIPDVQTESDKLRAAYDSPDGKVKVFHSTLWTMEYDLALGELAKLVNYATYIAQLVKSRSIHQNFKGISEKEAKKRIRKANEIYADWDAALLGQSEIAFKIYQRLKNKKASKAVTAQWLSKILLRYKSRVQPILKSDPQLKYIVDAIYHVTKPENGDS